MNLDQMDADSLLEKALRGEKLFPDEAIYLAEHADLIPLGMVANRIAAERNPGRAAGYAVSKTVQYSNVCQPSCPFTTGNVLVDDPRAFTKSAEEIVTEVGEAVKQGATQITLQGGHRIDLPWEYYTGLVKAVRTAYPEVQLFAYSPTEIMVFNTLFQKKTADLMAELQEAGMDGLLAGGAETMTARAPEYRALLRGPWKEWIEVVHRAADLSIPVIAPFVIGLGESTKERIGQLYRTREIQQRTKIAGKPAFARLSVFTLNVEAPEPSADEVTYVEGERVVAESSAAPIKTTGYGYLRWLALARILVPNIQHVQSSFVSQGAKVAQVGLGGGADELGGTSMEYDKVDLASGRVGAMTAPEMERLITQAGRRPELRARLSI
ncbi:MAG TPA: radical SAM protein [Symbiobacteriaceae bacterium]|nr:radical SAM protein [Symbiobacteriaceae bacterium]